MATSFESHLECKGRVAPPFIRSVTFDGFAQTQRIDTRVSATGPLAFRVYLRRDIMGRIAESASSFGATGTFSSAHTSRVQLGSDP